MKKRIKSFLITASSLLGTAFLAVVLTPEWASFLTFAKDKAIGWGIPVVIVSLVGVIIAEVWKQILNNIAIKKAIKNGEINAGGGSLAEYLGEKLY